MKSKGDFDLILQPDKIFRPDMDFSSETFMAGKLCTFGIGVHLDKENSILWLEVKT
jgi:hypothetical protein